MIIILVLVFIGILLSEAPKLLVQKHTKDLIVFLCLWTLALLVALLQAKNVELPSPVKPFIEMIKPYVSE